MFQAHVANSETFIAARAAAVRSPRDQCATRGTSMDAGNIPEEGVRLTKAGRRKVSS